MLFSRRVLVSRLASLAVATVGLPLLGGCGPPAQPATRRTARIGKAEATELVTNWRFFIDGLREHGWIEGQNLTFEILIADSPAHYEQLPQLMLELVSRKVDVIVASTIRPYRPPRLPPARSPS